MSAGVAAREIVDRTVLDKDVLKAAEAGASWHVVCGLLQRWAGWRGEARVGQKVGSVLSDSDILELGIVAWVKEKKIFEVNVGHPGGRRLLECVGEMERSESGRVVLPGLRIVGECGDFEGLASCGLIREIWLRNQQGDFGTFCEWLLEGGAPFVCSLRLRGLGLDADAMRVFWGALSGGALSSLTELYLGINEFGPEGMRWFSEALSEGALASLHTLDLNSVKIGPAGMLCFLGALSKGALSSLRDLDLGGNELGPEGMRWLSVALAEGALSSLQMLYLGLNEIGPEGMRVFSEVLSAGALSSLKKLTLEYNGIGSEGVRYFSHALNGGALSSLQWLDLENNNISADGTRIFLETLSRGAMPSLQHLSLLFNGPVSDRSIRDELSRISSLRLYYRPM